MIQRLRKRFIRIAMLSVALVLLGADANREYRQFCIHEPGYQ